MLPEINGGLSLAGIACIKSGKWWGMIGLWLDPETYASVPFSVTKCWGGGIVFFRIYPRWWFEVFFNSRACLGKISIVTNVFSNRLKPSPTIVLMLYLVSGNPTSTLKIQTKHWIHVKMNVLDIQIPTEVVYPIIYMVLYIPSGWPWDFFHQQYYWRLVFGQKYLRTRLRSALHATGRAWNPNKNTTAAGDLWDLKPDKNGEETYTPLKINGWNMSSWRFVFRSVS